MTSVRVEGMTCQGCESVVETAVEMLDGVESATADRYDDVVSVEGDVPVDDVVSKVELAGYAAGGEVTVTDADAADEADAPTDADDEAAADEPAEEAEDPSEAPADEPDGDELEE